jgi:hypothetical protein
MKIIDFIRDATIKTGTAIRESSDIGSSPENIGGILSTVASEADFSLPDLLQAFAGTMSRRQQLMADLPAIVSDKLKGSVPQAKGEDPIMAGSSRAAIQQGLAGLVRENRSLPDAMRLIASELEYIDRVPEFKEAFASAASAFESPLPALNSAGMQGQSSQPRITVPDVLQAAVEEGLASLQNIVVVESDAAMPAVSLGKLDDITLPPEAGTNAGAQAASTSAASAVQTALPNAAAETTGLLYHPYVSFPPVMVSLAGQFESLLSTLVSRPAALNQLLVLLPEVMAATGQIFPVLNKDDATTAAIDTLARSAPKWLVSMAEREHSSGLLEFWVRAKAADLAPWMKLSQMNGSSRRRL